jgi:hypothetical protein
LDNAGAYKYVMLKRRQLTQSKNEETRIYILYSNLFKLNASIDVILCQSHDIAVETGLRLKLNIQVNNKNNKYLMPASLLI